MSAGVGNFRDLVRKAHKGQLKLPGFQRTFRWKADKVVKLYDSLRLRYPIGSFLFLVGSGEALSPRAFAGSGDTAAAAETDYLVLDGQQRLTAGVHIFFASGPRQYYIDLNKVAELADERNVVIDDEESVAGFCANLDFEDAYLVSKSAVVDPRALLIKSDLLCTSIVTNTVSFNVAAADYLASKPHRTDLMLRIIQPHFSLSETDAVPHINIQEKTSLSAISRIFTTLNTTGQMLTPFELVVAKLFPSQIYLQKEIADFRERGIFYPRMDSTGEILLQTIAMLADVDQKKSNLPRTIDATNYTQHKENAFEALEALGKFLTDTLGCGLNVTGALVPYDAVYAPMARALQHVQNKKLSGLELAQANNKLRLWFAASALTQRYQEGVHNKQSKDFREVVAWIDGSATAPLWISEARTPSLIGKSFDGAIGKFVQCCINYRDPRDPVVPAHRVGYRSGAETTEKHHIYPTKFVQHLAGWDKATDKSDTLLNMMYVERGTNKRWLNANPRDHIREALKESSRSALTDAYRLQFIGDEGIALLEEPEKSQAQFVSFIDHRQKMVRDWIKDHFGIEPTDGPSEIDDEEADFEEELTPSS